MRLDPEMREEENGGFVIDLRRFSALPLDLVLTDKREWLKRSETYLRICRLRGLYKADLMQKFANLLVRVGLDDTRPDEHRRIFELISRRLVPGEGA